MKYIKIFLLLNSVMVLHLHAIELNEVMLDTIKTNPNILSKQSEYRSTYESLNIAKGDRFLPSIDLKGDIGESTTNYDKPNNEEKSNTNTNLSLTATENLFDGFGTKYNIQEKEYALAAAAYAYIATANEQALQSAHTYIDVIRNRELMLIEQDSLTQHQEIQKNIRIRNNSGVGVISDFHEIESKVNLAHANHLTQKKNYKNSQIILHKVLGRYLDSKTLVTPTINSKMPTTLDKATKFALKNHPALILQNYNVHKVRSIYKRDQKNLYYPSIDLVVSTNLHDGLDNDSGYESEYNQASGQVQFNWNLFRGFKDKATKQKNISLLQAENEKRNAVKRDIIQEVQLAFTTKDILEREYGYLLKFESESEKKLDTFHKEFKLGKRSLLELLSAQDDFNFAKQKLVNSRLDLLVAKLTVLKSLGILSDSVAPELKQSVGIRENGEFDYGFKVQKDSIATLQEDAVVIPWALETEKKVQQKVVLLEDKNEQQDVKVALKAPVCKRAKSFKYDREFQTFELKDSSHIYALPSKNKIENIAKATRVTGYFDNDGWVRIGGIVKNGSWHKYCEDGYIKASDTKTLKRKKRAL